MNETEPFNFSKIKEAQNIREVKIENKENYYADLMSLEGSWTGRLDAQFSNTFFHEAIQLIINSISLFEKGYFDCAFYSLRQSLEISTTAVYISDDEDDKRDAQLAKWKAKARFAMQAEMISQLEKRNLVFADIKDKMKTYFEELEDVKRKLNKLVHKQGFNTFYVSRNHVLNSTNKPEALLNQFETYLFKCIGAIAVFRLAIDPLPVLLADEEIYKRTDRFITEPYTKDFIDKYIGQPHIAEYKSTTLYQDHYAHFIKNEPMLQSVVNLVKDQYIDRACIDEILSQQHLLGFNDTVAFAFTILSDKIAKIHTMGGWLFYFTNIESNRKSYNFDSRDFNPLEEKSPIFNTKYDEAFLSCIKVNDDAVFLEHNSEFSDGEIDAIKNLVAAMEQKRRDLEDHLNKIEIK